MTSDSKKGNTTEHVNIDKNADILQATFKHYYDMAMAHNAKAATTSNILLVVVGAIIAIVGYDKVPQNYLHRIGAIAICVIGVFGVVWVRKQQERSHYWESIALQYQTELTKIVPLLKTRDAYEEEAVKTSEKEIGKIFTRRILERHLWVTLHIIVVILGLGLLLASLFQPS